MKPKKLAKQRRYLWSFFKKAVPQVCIDRPRSREEPEKGRLIPSDIKQILNRAEQNIDNLLPSMQELKSKGNYRMVFNALIGLALYRALRAEGMSKEYAIELFNDIRWKAYKNVTLLRFIRIILKIIYRDPFKQMKAMLDLLVLKSAPPGYEIETSSTSNTFNLDVYRCLPLEFIQRQNDKEALEWFRNTACVFDYAAAEDMAKGGRHERQHNLADGDNLCDQRWIVDDDKNKTK